MNSDCYVLSAADTQEIIDLFPNKCDAFGFTIILKKTKFVLTPVLQEPSAETKILCQGTRLDVLDLFLCLETS